MTRSREDAILTFRLLSCIRQHLIGLRLRMNEMHKTMITRLDLLTLVIWTRSVWPSISRKHLAFILPALPNLWLLQVLQTAKRRDPIVNHSLLRTNELPLCVMDKAKLQYSLKSEPKTSIVLWNYSENVYTKTVEFLLVTLRWLVNANSTWKSSPITFSCGHLKGTMNNGNLQCIHVPAKRYDALHAFFCFTMAGLL